MSGEIPLELIDLGALEILNLNDYSGGLRGEIPPEFGNFPNLEYLSLGGDGLTGEIPSELGNLSNLRDLSIEGNGLTGGFPRSWATWPAFNTCRSVVRGLVGDTA